MDKWCNWHSSLELCMTLYHLLSLDLPLIVCECRWKCSNSTSTSTSTGTNKTATVIATIRFDSMNYIEGKYLFISWL